MNATNKKTTTDQPAAHLRVVSDRAANAMPGIQLSGVSKTYRARDGDVPSLRPLDFHINEGEFFVVVGPVRLRQVHASQDDLGIAAAIDR